MNDRSSHAAVRGGRDFVRDDPGVTIRASVSHVVHLSVDRFSTSEERSVGAFSAPFDCLCIRAATRST